MINKYQQFLFGSLLALVVQSIAVPLVVAQEEVDEYQVKAAVLSRLMSFVSWPEGTGTETPSFCVFGINPFEDNLEAAFQNNDVMLHQIGNQIDFVDSCSMVFVSASEIRNYQRVLARIEGKSILSISDIPRFGLSGGMINLTFENRRVGFQINKHKIDSAKLKISFQLLNLAEIVETDLERGW